VGVPQNMFGLNVLHSSRPRIIRILLLYIFLAQKCQTSRKLGSWSKE